MSSSQSNELGQIYVKWDIKTQILRYVSARSVARNSNCPNSTLCSIIYNWRVCFIIATFNIFAMDIIITSTTITAAMTIIMATTRNMCKLMYRRKSFEQVGQNLSVVLLLCTQTLWRCTWMLPRLDLNWFSSTMHWCILHFASCIKAWGGVGGGCMWGRKVIWASSKPGFFCSQYW